MKSLQSYINEGLISDIILRLLDASIAWIGKGLDFIGDNIKASTSELWSTYKDSLKNAGDNPNANKQNPLYNIKNEKEFSKFIIENGLSAKTFGERLKEIDKVMGLFAEATQTGEDDEAYVKMYCELHYLNSKMTSASDTATAEEKKAAADKITEILNKGGQYRKIMKQIGLKQASIDKRNQAKQKKQQNQQNQEPQAAN